MTLRLPPEFGEALIAVVTSPAAGANFTYTFPAPYHYKLDGLRFKMITDGNAANRTIMLDIYTVGVPPIYYSSTILQPESLTRYWHMWAGLNTIDRQSFSQVIASFPPQIWLREGSIIATDIKNLQVGDQMSEIILYFRRWAP